MPTYRAEGSFSEHRMIGRDATMGHGLGSAPLNIVVAFSLDQLNMYPVSSWFGKHIQCFLYPNGNFGQNFFAQISLPGTGKFGATVNTRLLLFISPVRISCQIEQDD